MPETENKFFLLSLALFVMLISKCLLSKGMFLDGVYYAAIAKNLSEGKGQLFDLFYSADLDSHFRSHLPLMIWLEAALFKIFGTSFFIEKIFSAIVYLLAFFILRKIRTLTNPTSNQLSWLPVFIMILFPLTTWAAKNNVLENLMLFFALLSVLFILKGFAFKNINFVLAGLFAFLGFLSKGIQILFLLTVPFFMFFIFEKKDFRKLIISYILFGFGFVLPFLPFYLSPRFGTFLASYFDNTIKSSLSTNYSFKMFYYLARETLFPLLVVFWLFAKIPKANSYKSIIFASIAIFSIIPYFFSTKQRAFYLVPVLPFLALSWALVLENYVSKFSEKIEPKIIAVSTLVLFLASFLIMSFNFNGYCRDKELLEAIEDVTKQTKNAKNICIDTKIYKNWNIQAYFMRFYGISLIRNSDTCEFCLYSGKNNFKNCEKLIKNYSFFELYKSRETNKFNIPK